MAHIGSKPVRMDGEHQPLYHSQPAGSDSDSAVRVPESVPDVSHPLTDVVVICRPGNDNEELRYVLRSLQNLPHGRVWIVGAWPDWVRNVEKVPVVSPAHKQISARNNLIAACQHPDISDPFYVFNDDFYVMQKLIQLPTWHGGNLDAFIAQHRAGGSYRVAMQATRDRLVALGEHPDNLVTWDLHIPMLIEKLGMLMALDLGKDIRGLHNRTMYGNLMRLSGEEHSDVKVYIKSKLKEYEHLPLLSTSDRTFRMHPVGKMIRAQFNKPSEYEHVRAMQSVRRQRQAVRYSYSVIHHPR